MPEVSDPAPPHGTPGGSGQFGIPRERLAHWARLQPLPRVLELAASKAASLEAAHIPPPLTVQEGIMRLKKLLEAGAITESEFEAKKTELLHRL